MIKRLSKSSLFKAIIELLIFAFPIVLGQLSQMLIGAGDVLIAARHSTETVAAIGLANGVISFYFIGGMGMQVGISPLLSQKRGAKIRVDHYLPITLFYSLIIAIIIFLVNLAVIPLIPKLGFEENLVPLIQDYMYLFSFSFFGAYLFQGIREFLQAKEKVVFPNIISILSVVLNLLVNYIFVFGMGPIPSLGIRGLAYASILIRTLMALTITIYTFRYFIKMEWVKGFLAEVIKLSFPIAITILLEVGAFSMGTLLIGRFGTIQVAAHNLILTLASITFMVPLGVTSAVAVKIGYFFGEKNLPQIKLYALSALTLSGFFMSMTALSFFLFPAEILGMLTTDINVIQVAIPLLLIVAIFQLSDGFQVTLSGILRGMSITKPVSIIALFGYWGIGIPLGIYLAFNLKMQAMGIWSALALALFLVAISLLILCFSKYRQIKIQWQ